MRTPARALCLSQMLTFVLLLLLFLLLAAAAQCMAVAQMLDSRFTAEHVGGREALF